MEKAKHTPGPWTLNTSSSILSVEDEHSGDGSPICYFPEEFYRQNPETYKEAVGQWHENARLISAAPTMASRMQGAIDCLSQNKVFPADIEQAIRLLTDGLNQAGIDVLPLDRAAIAKATGGK